MIAGPIFPRTLESLWELLQEDPGRLEWGLSLVCTELVFEGGLVVDALARDAIGAPVLIFVAGLGHDRELPNRVIEARDWFARSQRILASAVEHAGMRLDLPARTIVVGFEFGETCLSRLRSLGDEGLAVFRYEGFLAGGRRHIGVLPMIGTERSVGLPFEPPPAFLTTGRRELVAGLFDLLQRLDPTLRAEGDRFSRRFFAHGALLAELHVGEDGLWVSVPGSPPRQLLFEADRNEAFDGIMRRYLAGPATAPAPAGADASDEKVREPLEPRFVRTEITQEEYDAFQILESNQHPI